MIQSSKDKSVSNDVDYNIIDDLKKIWANISLFELAKLLGTRDLITNNFASAPSTSKAISSSNNLPSSQTKAMVSFESIMNVANVGNNSKSSVPTISLNFYIYNYKVHNYLVDYGAWMNVMSLYVCKKINYKLEKIDANIVQLDRSQVQVTWELNNVFITLSSNSWVN